MTIKSVEPIAPYYMTAAECTSCGYHETLSVPQGKIIVRTICPACGNDTLDKKGKPSIQHTLDQ